MWKNFEKYAQFSDLRELYTKVMPELQKFEKNINENNKDIAK